MTKNKNIDDVPTIFTKRVRNLFGAIFSYHFNCRPSFSNRETSFSTYASMIFRKATKSPLLLLLKEGLISEPNSIEILVKNTANQKIDDTDLESVILSVRNNENTLIILITKGEVPSDDFERLFRVFTRHLVIILPLGEKDILKLEKFVENGNINACLIVLFMLANRITSGEEKLYGRYTMDAKWQEEAILARLDKMTNLKGPQLWTLIKKLCFLTSFEKSGGERTKACAYVHISRKTFYLWLEKDPIFRKLLGMK